MKTLHRNDSAEASGKPAGRCTDSFERAFASGCGGVVRTCDCGRTYFDEDSESDFDTGEYAQLCAKADAAPDLYIRRSGTIETLEVDCRQFVIGCDCGGAARYEIFIRGHAVQIKRYLERYADQLRTWADDVDPRHG